MNPGSADLVRYDVEGGMATLTLHRPEARNALSPALMEALLDALHRARADTSARVVVLTGSGDRAFCAGGDLGSQGMQEGFLASHAARSRFAEVFRVLNGLGKPVVARVNGDALGGGFGLALACDLVVAVEDARMGTPEVNLGLFPHVILATLTRNIPRKRVMRMVLTGEKISAAQAAQEGFITEAVPRTELDAAMSRWCQALLSKSPAVLKLGRDAFYAVQDMSFDQGLSFLESQLSLNILAEDAMEGVSAFLQKRPPQWKGR